MENIVKNEFQFYSKLAKPLILNLPKSRDRILAAAWIKKFMDEKAGDEMLRTTYLKLLLFCLQRRKLTGIFSDDPIEYDLLEDLPPEFDLNDLAKNLLEQEKEERKDRMRLEMMGDMAIFPAYTTDCSPDLTEYVAAQDIPNFGVHAYYAISRQPINKWQKPDKAILPKGTKSAIDTSITAAGGPLDVSCVCAPKGAASAPEVEEAPADADKPECRKMKDKETSERKKRRPKNMGQSPPTHPIGDVRQVEEERVTPTWGTNLLEVKELTDIGKIDEPTDEQIQLEEEASKILEEEAAQEDEEEEGPEEVTASKTEDMLHIIDEYKLGQLDKSKAKKIPERLLRLGDRSGIKVPKSTKAPPKIKVKGTKQGKGKGKYGPRPDNLPDEFADWTEKDLEDAGLTWDDLMPVDEDIDAELEQIEQEEMAGLEDDGLDDVMPDAYEGLDYDAMIREAEADLERHKSTYDAEVEEDEPVVDLFDEEIEELEDELNLSRAAEELQTASPALTSGVPVTTPKRSPIPRRSKSPEKTFAEEDDVLLQPRVSPLRAPKEDPTKKKKSGIPMISRLRPPKKITAKDPNISKVYESARAAVDKSFMKHKKESEEEEFERLERQFAAEQGPSTSRRRSPMLPPASPGAAQRVFERAQQQEQELLRTSPAPQDPHYLQFAEQFADAEDESCLPCSPPPLAGSPQQVYSPTTGAPLPIPEFPYEREDVGSPDRFDYLKPPKTPEYIHEARRRLRMEPTELKFVRDYEGAEEDVGQEEPCVPCGSPPPMTAEEEFEFLEGFYGSPAARPQQVYSPTTGAPLDIPEFDYGPENVDDPNRFDYMRRPTTPDYIKEAQIKAGLRAPSPPPPQPQPQPQPQLPTEQEIRFQRAATATRAWEQEVRLRQGSPQAAEIIQEAEVILEGDLGRRLRIGQDKMLEESPPPFIKTPPKKIQLPPRPVFSPTTAEHLPVPDFNIAPEDLGVPWEEGAEEIPEFERVRQADYLYMPTMEEREAKARQARTDIFERMGEPYIAAVDTAPRRPQFFPPGMDVVADSPPLSLRHIEEHEIPEEFYDLDKRRQMMGQSNICVGARRREKFMRRKGAPITELSPIEGDPYHEYLHDKLAEHEYKGPVPQAKGLSPWREEEVYYTPTEGDSTLEDLDWPLASPPRTPPCQRPEQRPFGFESPFAPGVSSPMTPPLQRPEERPEGFKSPFIPGVSSPITPDPQGEYPFRRFHGYRSPPSPETPLPMEAYFDPLDYEGIGLSDAELEDVSLLSPDPCTPCGDERMATPPRRTPTQTRRREIPADLDLEESPRRPAPRQMMARRLFTDDQLLDESPPRPASPERPPPSRLPPRGQIPTRIPSRGQIPTRIPSRGQIPCRIPSISQIPSRIPSRGQIPSKIPSRGQIPSRIPSRGQIPSRIPSRGQIPSKIPPRGQIASRIPSWGQISSQMPPARAPVVRPVSPPQRPSPAPYPGDQETPVSRRPPQQQMRRVPQRQSRIGTPTGVFERPSRRLFEGEDEGVDTTCAPCEAEPAGTPQPRRSPKHVTPLQPRRSPKHVTPPPPEPRPVTPPWFTPEGMEGPSRRPTGQTPEFYNSDFESPPRIPPSSPKFAPAKRIKKKGRPPPSPTTPDQRTMPSPYMPSSPPCRAAQRRGGPVQMLSRRIFQERGEMPRMPPEEPPIEYSPVGPFVPDEGWVSPLLPPPEHYKDPMYFPPQVMDQESPHRRDYPTLEEIKEHELVQDKAYKQHSRLKGMGVGPGPFIYRDYTLSRARKVLDTPQYRMIPDSTPEYPPDYEGQWRADLYGRKDLEWEDMMKYIDFQHPAQHRPSRRPPPRFEFPTRQRSPRQVTAPPPCEPCGEIEDEEDEIMVEVDEDVSFPSGYEDAFEEVLETNLQVPPEQYPPPAGDVRAPSPPRDQGAFEQRFGDQATMQRAEAFLAAANAGTLDQHIGQREFEEIAEQADIFFDTAGGLLDQTPPDQIGQNYYPDVLQATDQLGRSIMQYDLSPSPLPSPFIPSPGTPPGLPPQWSPASVPSGSPRTPPPRQVAPSRGTIGPCGAGTQVAKKPSKSRVPPKPTQLRETKSSQLRKQMLAKKEKEKFVSPTTKMMMKRKEKAAKAAEAAEEKKKKRESKRKAEEAAKRAESMARIAEGLPGGKMRPLDYRSAKGTGGAPCLSAEKEIPLEMEAHEDAPARRMLFGGPKSETRPGPAEAPGASRGFTGRKTKARKLPLPPLGVCGRRDSDDDLAVPLSEQGPEFTSELLQHQVSFPSRQVGVVVGGKHKRIPRRSDQALSQMDEIVEETRSPCAPCGGEDDDDYQGALFQQALTEIHPVEQAIIQREQEERDYFEAQARRTEEEELLEFEELERQMAQSPVGSPARPPPRRIMTEEEEQMEFEEFERQMAIDAAEEAQVCPGARSPRAAPPLDEAALQQERMMRRRLLEQQIQTQGPPIRGRPFPAAGVPYSPPRPQPVFGPSPYEQRAGRLPVPSPPRPVTPPRQPTPPYRTPSPARTPSPRIPSPPSPPPPPPGVLEETPPYFEGLDEDFRFPTPPCRPPSPPRWVPTPSPPRAPSPPPFIPTPPSPPLLAGEVRQQIASMARPEFDPGRRRDLLPRDERRAFRTPGVGLYNVQEDEPLIPELGNESFMGWPVVPGERAPKKRRRPRGDLKAKQLFGKSEVSKMCRKLAKKYDLPELPPEPQSPEDYILDEPLPQDLPRPMAPQWPRASPIRRLPLEPVPLAPWEGVGYRQPGPKAVSPCRPQMPDIREIYQGWEGPVHPDLTDLVGYEPPMEIPEGVEDLGGMEMGEEAYYSPERYPEIEERELDREAALAYEPPWVMKNIWLSSPKEMGVHTPPSIGKGPCGTYTPTATPPLQVLDSPLLGDFGDDFVAPDRQVPGQALQDFFVRTPPLERETSIQELRYYTQRARGREGIKPRPMHFGGYGETPQRPIPRWYGRGGARNVIEEVEVPFSPPTPGTPPPQLPAPCSPELTEFEQLERQMQEEEAAARGGRRSKRRRRREEIEAAQRQMGVEELTEQAERREMERRMAARRALSPPRPPSPQRAPSPPRAPRIPTPPPLPPFQYGPEMPVEDGPYSPCGPPPIDHRALEQFMLQEMDFDPSANALITPPGTPEYIDQGMYDVFEGFESPPPLSPEPEGICMPCTPPAPPSPPPPPASPQKPQWQIIAEDLERQQRERQAREARKQELYQRNMEDIRQTFGPSPGPPSPGPDIDFFANIYSHQIPASFRQGDRPMVAVRDQIGTREQIMRLPRHTPATGIASTVITEPRVRITVPEGPRRRMPPSRPRAPPAAAAAAPQRQVEQKSSAQRIAEARKHYQQMGRQRKLGTPQGGPRPQPVPEVQLNLQPVEDFLRQPEQQASSCSDSGPCGAARPKITPQEAQRRARERLKARKRQEVGASAGRAPPVAPAPPPLRPFTGFLPTQVQRTMPRPEPGPELQPQSVQDFIRGGPRLGAGPSADRTSSRTQRAQPSTSGTQIRRQPSTSRQGGGCGGGKGCGSGRR